jgi:hypothetical protein
MRTGINLGTIWLRLPRTYGEQKLAQEGNIELQAAQQWRMLPPNHVAADPPEAWRFCDSEAFERRFDLSATSGGRLNFSIGRLAARTTAAHPCRSRLRV